MILTLTPVYASDLWPFLAVAALFAVLYVVWVETRNP
jgi:hypothetical protein